MARRGVPHTPAAQRKLHTVMAEFKHGTLHSGSGGKVTNRAQAIAIAMHEARKAGRGKR